MTITKNNKVKIVKNLVDKFSKAKSIVFLGFEGLTVQESLDFRKKLKAENAEFKVAKKTLIKRGLKDIKAENVDELDMEGPVGVALGYEDEISAAKLSNEYSKTNSKLKILGGFIGINYIKADRVKALAVLPGKSQLQAQLIGTINAPASGLVNVLAGNMRNLIYALKAVGEKKK